MKKIILLFVIFLVGCGAHKKSLLSEIKSDSKSIHSEIKSEKNEKNIDTTRTDSSSMIITEIEFLQSVGDEREFAQNINLPGIGTFPAGSVKSFKQTVISTESEKKGVSSGSIVSNTEAIEAVNVNSSEIKSNEIEPVPDPYRWRYIFYILIAGFIVLMYVKRIPILNWIKTILTSIRKII